VVIAFSVCGSDEGLPPGTLGHSRWRMSRRETHGIVDTLFEVFGLGVGFGVWGLGFEVWGKGFGGKGAGLGFRVERM